MSLRKKVVSTQGPHPPSLHLPHPTPQSLPKMRIREREALSSASPPRKVEGTTYGHSKKVVGVPAANSTIKASQSAAIDATETAEETIFVAIALAEPSLISENLKRESLTNRHPYAPPVAILR